MKKVLRIFLLAGLLTNVIFVGHANANAKVLQVAVSPENRKFFPEVFERVVRALKSTGYDVDLVELPRKRSLHMVMKGEIALELGMTRGLIPQDSGLVQINPPILDITLTMATSSQTPDLCRVSKDNFSGMSIAGVLGSKTFELYYAPKFAESFSVKNYVDMLQMVILQRADVTFVALGTTHLIPDEIKTQLTICGTHLKNIVAHSYLHKNFLWAKEKIEAAYKIEFGQN